MIQIFSLVVFAFLIQGTESRTTLSAPPIISSIQPYRGSTQGGTRLTITGYNFAQNGIFSTRTVLIGNAPCNVINYYTTDGQIICITPACTDPTCINDVNEIKQYTVVSALSLYVTTVEGILGTSSSFTYSTSYTPAVLSMSHYTWGTATSSVRGYISAAYLEDVSVMIGSSGLTSNAAFIGEPGDLNAELWGNSNYRWYYSNGVIYYRPPVDMTAGAFNASLVIQDTQDIGWGSGSARMFSNQGPIGISGIYDTNSYQYNFDATLSGTPYSLFLFPSISSIFPAVGSVAGGTSLTISGSGFSKNITKNLVYAGGEPCSVTASDFNYIKCTTSPIADSQFASYKSDIQLQSNGQPAFTTDSWSYTSRRKFGSPGFWMKMWDYSTAASNSFSDSNVRLSLGFKQDFAYSFSNDMDKYNWQTIMGYDSKLSTQNKFFAAEYIGVLVAPYTGVYTFYANGDDTLTVRGALYDPILGYVNEQSIISVPSYTEPGDFMTYDSINHSPGIRLTRGSRYRLRTSLYNRQGNDNIEVAMRIDPDYDAATGFLLDGVEHANGNDGHLAPEILAQPAPLSFSPTFLHHHAVREVQNVTISATLIREVQTISIWGIKSGTFDIIIQNEFSTYQTPISISTSASDISKYMTNALKVTKTNFECTSFSVSKKVQTFSDSSSAIFLAVSFNADRESPFTMLKVYTARLQVTSNFSTSIVRTQLHSPVPGGSFDLIYTSPLGTTGPLKATIPLGSPALFVRDALQALTPELNVAVTYEISGYTYTWFVTFTTPRGQIPLLKVNTSQAVGADVKGIVSTYCNGSAKSLWFNPIPGWLLEVPLMNVSGNSISSNVEVYVQSDAGDISKAVCDSSGVQPTSAAVMFKNSENSCKFTYSSKISAIVSNFSLVGLDAVTTQISIFGSGFLIAGSEMSALVTVSIANYSCNITSISDSAIGCLVQSVPWGSYAPVVNIPGYGYAVVATSSLLKFKQTVYSVSPIQGSYMGGQVITITGRGFRPSLAVRVGNVGVCTVLYYSSSLLKCRTPAAYSITSSSPTRTPTFTPSSRPTFTYPPTFSPSVVPTYFPSVKPTTCTPTFIPTYAPTAKPTFGPSAKPSTKPSYVPTAKPTIPPTFAPSRTPSIQPTAKPSFEPSMKPSTVPTAAPTMRPSSEPSFSPSRSPSNSPTVRPTHLPTFKPSTNPTNEPTLRPSAEPSMKPSSGPTAEPTLKPSAEPSYVPSRIPSSAPTAKPTAEPSYVPSRTPSSAPTVKPTAEPSYVPSRNPSTLRPSAEPSYVPSRKPSSTPTAKPTAEPSYVPSRTPSTVKPTAEPSYVPSRTPSTVRPSAEPSYIPSRTPKPTVRPSAGPSYVPSRTPKPTVRPSSAPSRNTARTNQAQSQSYNLSVPIYITDFFSGFSYIYRVENTPVILSVFPANISSAITTNITISFSGFKLSSTTPSNISVVIGTQRCTHTSALGFSISCTLLRSAANVAVSVQPVKVLFPGVGFGSSVFSKISYPTVTRGFEISSLNVQQGSVLGGNVLSVSGFGFDPSKIKQYSIVLNRVGLEPLNSYDELLNALGFPAYTTRYPEDILTCNITSMTSSSIFCLIPPHDSPYNFSYNILLAINNVSAVCATENNCTYVQNYKSTPTVTSITVLSSSNTGTYTISIKGTLLSAGALSVAIGSAPCVVSSIVNSIVNGKGIQTVVFSTPSLVAGTWPIIATVAGYGQALSTVDFRASVSISATTFDSAAGSFLGGTFFTLTGSGFSLNCSENILSLKVKRITDTFNAPVTDLRTCTKTSIVAVMPTLVGVVSNTNLQLLPAFTTNISAFSISLTTSAMGALSASTLYAIPLNSFVYSNTFTPLVLANASTGFSGSVVSFRIFSVFSISVPRGILINGSACGILNQRSQPATVVNNFNYNYALAVTCNTPPLLPASSVPYNVLIYVKPIGYASMLIFSGKKTAFLPTFSPLFSVNKLVPNIVSSSVLGGSSLSIYGKGFPRDAVVSICDNTCNFDSSNEFYGNLTCTIPSRWTTQAVQDVTALNISLDLVNTVNGTYFGSSTINSVNIVDSNVTSFTSINSKTCFIGLRLSPGYFSQAYRMRFYPKLQWAYKFSQINFEGSRDGVNYQLLGSVYGAHEGWNFIDASSQTNGLWFKSFRFRVIESKTSSLCSLAEIEFLGVVASVNATCPVVVSSPSLRSTSNVGFVSYNSLQSFTPYVQSVYPNNGSALGGNTVTLYGMNFDSFLSSDRISVSFSGVTCTVISSTASTIRCITGPRRPEDIETSSISVNVPGRGLALIATSAQYLYIDKWSALTTWLNQEPPVDGDVVWVPDGQVILLDVKTPVLTFLLIEGALYFDRTKDLTLDSSYIFVLGGYMECGTESKPFERSAVITLHGDRYKTIEVPPIGSKVLAVADKGIPSTSFETGAHTSGRNHGQLEIHGQKRIRTWTKVAATATAGTFTVITSEAVDFKAGESVILTGTNNPDCKKYLNCFGYEELVIKSNYRGFNLTFTTPLAYDHESQIVTIEGRTVDMRCEIGLLSRNVIIQGDANSDGQLFGVHTVAMMSGIYRIENAEIRRCGQSFNFGRYCTHSHKGGDMQGSYVNANSIHHSYQRAVTIHDTNNWEVRDNVAFDVRGHAYFVEDGTEQYNSITGNLGVLIRTSSALLKSDHKPAIFWTSTPLNFWRDNVAAHSASHGFWFELSNGVPLEPGETPVCPFSQPLGEFRNNTFHSNNVNGLRIYPGWGPRTDPCDPSSPTAPQYLRGLVSFHNNGNGLFAKHHGDLHHVFPTVIGSGANDVNFAKIVINQLTDDPTMTNSLIVGRLDLLPNSNLGKFGIFAPQGEYFYVSNATFVNYGTTAVLTGCNSCLSAEMMAQGAFTARYEGLKFVNSTLRVKWMETKKEILWDLDGSLAGVSDAMLTRSYGSLLYPDDCTVLPPSQFSDTVRCGGGGSSTRIRRMQVENVSPSQLLYTDLTIKSEAGSASFYFLPLDSSGWVFPVVTGNQKSYTMIWAANNNMQTRSSTLTLGRPSYLLASLQSTTSQYDEDVIMVQDLTQTSKWDYNPYSFQVTYGSSSILASKNDTPLVNMGDSKYYNYLFNVLLTNKGDLASSNPFKVSTSASLCPPSGCTVPPVQTPASPLLWSDPQSWPSNNYAVPTTGQTITIASDMWIVLDVSPPKLGCINIYGKLTFLSDAANPRNLTLSVQCISLWGSMQIIGANNTEFSGSAKVIIYGLQGASPPVSMGTNFVGSKVIAIAGSLEVKGQSKGNSWVKLNSTASAGSNTIIVNGAVAWNPDDEVVLSPTGYYNANGGLWKDKSGLGVNAETRTILGIQYIANLNCSRLTLNSPLNHTHLCTSVSGERFCGAVGVLTRNVQFISTDGENPSSYSYGFGANIRVVDVVSKGKPTYYGWVAIRNVAFSNFGKVNSDHYVVAISHVDYNHRASALIGCAFVNGYNMVSRISRGNGFAFDNNVAFGMFSGGVFIEATTKQFIISRNLLIATYQLPAVLTSSYPWVRPIATFTVLSSSGKVFNNIAAGSDDQGFALATSLFTRKVSSSQCAVTKSAKLSYSLQTLSQGASVFGNEAVGCKGGLSIITVSSSESTSSDCAVVTSFKGWRNAYTGIMSADTEPDMIIANVVLAENHIGMSLHFYKTATSVLSGLVDSLIIGSLSLNSSSCTDLPDSLWTQGRHCHGFTETDPLGQSTVCGSVISKLYRRVGLLVPQWTNKPRTCALAQRFGGPVCDPPNTPDRLCEMPFEKRYGLPIDVVYAEQHIHNTVFAGFQTASKSRNTASNLCIPSNNLERSSAIALNPSQSDYQPTGIISLLRFPSTDLKSRFTFDSSMMCADLPCSGLNMMLIQDVDGSLGHDAAGIPGQLVLNNPQYVAPYPSCYELADIQSKLYFCPTRSNGFEQYTALWRDYGPQIIQPIITERRFRGEAMNRTFGSYGPLDDLCAKRFYYSRFNLLIANGTKHSISSTGTTPDELLFRWNAPSSSHVAIVEIFYQTSYDVSVLMSNDPYDGFTSGEQLDRYPTLADRAGSYVRDPQRRVLAVTIRGGNYSYYRFREAPSVAVTIRLSLDFATFAGDTFIANMAMLLSVDISRIKIVTVTKGSTIVNFKTLPSFTTAVTAAAVQEQVNEANFIRDQLEYVIILGRLEKVLNTTLLNCMSVFSMPQLLQPFNSTVDYPANVTVNMTAIRNSYQQFLTIQKNLIPEPTSQPSREPSRQPSFYPRLRPSNQPTGEPTIRTMKPTRIPTYIPTVKPSSIKPSRIPSFAPTAKPSIEPSFKPSAIPTYEPTRRPSAEPSFSPTRCPTMGPTVKPTFEPSAKPSASPTYEPTLKPSAEPTFSPSRIPTMEPTVKPSFEPSVKPSASPTCEPTLRPSAEPIFSPTRTPTGEPTFRPTHCPTIGPTAKPSFEPSTKPTRIPTMGPTCLPSRVPTMRPTAKPSFIPSVKPSFAPTCNPSFKPSGIPTITPTKKPSHEPSISPSANPSSIRPSFVPSSAPTRKPSSGPTNIPTRKPSVEPSSKLPIVTPSLKPSTTAKPSKAPAPVRVSPSVAPTRSLLKTSSTRATTNDPPTTKR